MNQTSAPLYSGPARLRNIPAAALSITRRLDRLHLQLAIGSDIRQLRMTSAYCPDAVPNINKGCSTHPESGRLRIELVWCNHTIVLWLHTILLYRALRISLSDTDIATIPPGLFEAAAANAIGNCLHLLPEQATLRFNTIEPDTAMPDQPGKNSIRLHGSLRQPFPADIHPHVQVDSGAVNRDSSGPPQRDVLDYEIAIDVAPDFSALLDRFSPASDRASRHLRPAPLRLPLRLQCEIGRTVMPYRALETLHCGDILFFESHCEPYFAASNNVDDKNGMTATAIRLCYRAHAVIRASLQQSGQMVITSIDMNDSKSFFYEDGLPDVTAQSRTSPYGASAVAREDAMLADEYDTFGEHDAFDTRTPEETAVAAAGNRHAGRSGHDERGASASPGGGLAQLPLQLLFDIGECEMTMLELQALQVGDVIPLASPVSEAARVTVNGRVIASGELVEIDGKLGVVLTRLSDAL